MSSSTIMTVVGVAVGALSALTLVPTALLLLQAALARMPARSSEADAALAGKAGRHGRVAVLVPAHDEAEGIAATLMSIAPQLRNGDRMLVVADNCADDTACIAEACGAEAVERNAPNRRGKGYALDFGVRHLELDPPDIVIVVDADCQVHPGAIEQLSVRCESTSRPVQALYLMHAPEGAGVKLRIAEFAWLVKNMVRPLGFSRMNLPCHLMGTGMAFPWKVIGKADLATGHIVEDLKLGLELTEAGTAPLFCASALVSSVFPATQQGVHSQRTRWERGHIGLILRSAPRLLLRSAVTRDPKLLAVAMDLSVPPLALLASSLATLTIAGAVLWSLARLQLPLYIAMFSVVILVSAIIISWWRFGRKVVSITDLLFAPFYALSKLPMYLKFPFSKQTKWIRSARDRD